MSKKDRLIYLPLGGAGEIGMNMYLYGYGPKNKERYILVDVGVTFPDMDSTPGVDLIMADASYIIARADRLDAIIITHAHEDHIGAVGLLYPQLKAPIYARKFTAMIASNKMERAGLNPDQVNVVPVWPAQIDIGPFKVGFMPIAHSIPEASGLVIDTPVGRIVHTGDFKTDPTPLVGEPFDPELMADIAKGGVKALICDSTNVFSKGVGRSEASISKDIHELMKTAKGMVFATTFGSNVARLKTLAQAATDEGRSVVVVGRAMDTMIKAAFATGVLKDFPPIVDLEDAGSIPRNQMFVLATGSQGERRAATAGLARGKYRGLELKDGDTFLFSSKTIPGNENSVSYILNQMAEKGVTVIDDSDGRYHVSGHANRPDLEQMHALMKADVVIPMHGQYRHLREHAEVVQSNGNKAVIVSNGTMIDLTNKPKIVDHIETGRTYLDGKQLIGALDGIVRERIQMALRGHVVVSLVLEEDGSMIDGVWVETIGLPNDPKVNGGVDGQLEKAIDKALSSANRKTLNSDEGVESLVGRISNQVCKDIVGKKPVCTVLINRLVAE
ncbi:MBL fold hydrolase [Rhodobacterales bacterium 52_120_T64]|nr:MBL fold hydrolase [Rhodobacterales bacterium 52_120_T64]